MNRYLTELVGTFFLVFNIGLCLTQQLPLAPLVIGAGLMVLVFMGAHVSGAHYNPAISLAIAMRGKLPWRDLPWYWAAQLVGAFSASTMVWVIMGKSFPIAPGAGVGAGSALLIEILYTFALTLVVLNVATTKSNAGNSFYGLAIGATIIVAAFAGGGISGGAYNPAVGIGPAIVHALASDGALNSVWIYILGPFIGAVLGAIVFRIQNPHE